MFYFISFIFYFEKFLLLNRLCYSEENILVELTFKVKISKNVAFLFFFLLFNYCKMSNFSTPFFFVFKQKKNKDVKIKREFGVFSFLDPINYFLKKDFFFIRSKILSERKSLSRSRVWKFCVCFFYFNPIYRKELTNKHSCFNMGGLFVFVTFELQLGI